MSYFNIVCDSCGRGVQGITWVNGMKFCAKCYQETFGASKDWQLLDKDKTIAEQQQRIAELEEQLKNAIVPKFRIGQEVWHLICEDGIKSDIIKCSEHMYVLRKSKFGVYEDLLFATKEEAQAKLEELSVKNV